MSDASFKEVQATYALVKKNHYQQWAVNKANEKAAGVWKLIELSRDDMSRIILPNHLHPTLSMKPLISKEGATLADAVSLLQSKYDYSRTNAACWRSIEFLRDNTTAVILSVKPIPSFDYWFLNKLDDANLYHVDGLHRMLAWSLYSNDRPLRAYVAGIS